MEVAIQKSSKPGKHYQATDGKRTTYFGDSSYSDFTKHKDEQRKKNYISRHSNEDQSVSNALSPAFLARHGLWSEKSVPESVRKLNKKYSSVHFRLA